MEGNPIIVYMTRGERSNDLKPPSGSIPIGHGFQFATVFHRTFDVADSSVAEVVIATSFGEKLSP